MSKPATVRGARATLILSLTMSFIGVTGVMHAYSLVTGSRAELAAANAEREDDAWLEFAEEAITSPVMKGVQVANLLVSVLLIIGSVLLTGRRHTALWWTRQALIANVLYTFGNAAGTMWFAGENRALIDALLAPDGNPQGPTMVLFGIGTSCGAVLVSLIYAVLLRVSYRDDVRSFVMREEMP